MYLLDQLLEILQAGNGIEVRYMTTSTSLKGKIFVDTNIFVYLVDDADKEKQKLADRFLSGLEAKHAVTISTQVMQEFYSVATRRVKICPSQARTLVEGLERFDVARIEVKTIKEAMTTSELYKISFWDALIVAAAIQKKCSMIITEDLGHEQSIHGIKIINPFLV